MSAILVELLTAELPPWLATVAVVSGTIIISTLFMLLRMTFNRGRFGWQRRLRTKLGLADGKRLTELLWLNVVAHTLTWLYAAWLLLHIWGRDSRAAFMSDLLTGSGFMIGSYSVVPAAILLGVFWFLALFVFTRWLKRNLQHRWLPRSDMEPATLETIATLFGYTTFVVAAVVGLSTAGLDFTKLAFIVGALSLGIGFGLQNIVNNFVSGLIILFERPIRTGDYVITEKTEGFVRRIRIRSTVLETWDHETVVVPNADFLSHHVTNLHLNDTYGRVIIDIGVAYGSDTARVRELLLDIANTHELVVKDDTVPGLPGPFVNFADFGESSLDFQLRVFILDVTQRLSTASDLRFAIDQALRDNDIVIPFPQRDLWVKALPAGANSGAESESPQKQADESVPPGGD